MPHEANDVSPKTSLVTDKSDKSHRTRGEILVQGSRQPMFITYSAYVRELTSRSHTEVSTFLNENFRHARLLDPPDPEGEGINIGFSEAVSLAYPKEKSSAARSPTTTFDRISRSLPPKLMVVSVPSSEAAAITSEKSSNAAPNPRS